MMKMVFGEDLTRWGWDNLQGEGLFMDLLVDRSSLDG